MESEIAMSDGGHNPMAAFSSADEAQLFILDLRATVLGMTGGVEDLGLKSKIYALFDLASIGVHLSVQMEEDGAG